MYIHLLRESSQDIQEDSRIRYFGIARAEQYLRGNDTIKGAGFFCFLMLQRSVQSPRGMVLPCLWGHPPNSISAEPPAESDSPARLSMLMCIRLTLRAHTIIIHEIGCVKVTFAPFLFPRSFKPVIMPNRIAADNSSRRRFPGPDTI